MAYTRLNLEKGDTFTADHLKHIEEGVVEACRSDVKEYQRVTYFTIDVECTQPQTTQFTAVGVNTAPYANKVYKDNCVLYLPATYSPEGTPVKLVIFCKQGSSQITDSSSPIENLKIFNYLISLGYAVLGVDGMPDGLVSELKLDDTRVVGNYVAARATSLAYDYVVDNYNIDSNGCFIFGYSQGGHYAQNVVDLTPIPILAVAEMSPVCSMRYHQWDLKTSKTIGGVSFTRPARLNIARLYGFPTVANDTDLANLEYNAMNVAGYDPWTRNVIDPYMDFVQSGNLWKLPDGVDLNDITMKKFTRAPLKIWCAENDTALGCDVMKVYIKAIKNAGQIADIRVYSTGGHSIYSAQSSIGTFTENNKSHNLIPVAYEIAQWYNNFGGYLPTTTASLSSKPIVYTPDVELNFEPSYKVSYNLSVGGSYSGFTSVPENDSYKATITIADGYALSDEGVVVVMGGTPVANATSINGNIITIEINSVADDIEIRANFINSTTGSVAYEMPLTGAMISVVEGENFFITASKTNRITSASSSKATGILIPNNKTITISGISGLRMDYVYANNAGPVSTTRGQAWGGVGTGSNFVEANYFPYNVDGSDDSVTITNNHESDYYFFFGFAAPNKSDNIPVANYQGKIIYSVEK